MKKNRTLVMQRLPHLPLSLCVITLGMLGSLGCDDDRAIRSPTEPSPGAATLSGFWDLELENDGGDHHSGVLFLEQEGGAVWGEISWQSYEEPLAVTGRIEQRTWIFNASWRGWDCPAGRNSGGP